MTPFRIQRKRSKGWRMPPNTVYVGRGSIFGNPFIAGKDGDERTVVDRYLLYVQTMLNGSGFLSSRKTEIEKREILESLRGKNLACWCRLDQPCHADVLLKLANEGKNEHLIL